MVIVSKVNYNLPGTYLSYDEFIAKAFSDEGLDIDDILMININDMTQDVYEATREFPDRIKLFSLTGACPMWADPSIIEDWRDKLPQQNVQPIQQVPTQQSQQPQQPEQGAYQQPQQYDQPQPQVQPEPRPQTQPQQQPQPQEPRSQPQYQQPAQQQQYAMHNQRHIDQQPTQQQNKGPKKARTIVFGSSKGGTGKTFTSIISTYRYAKTHPNERVALVDFDIIDGQVGIAIHKVRPTLRKYFTEYQKGYDDFETMRAFAVRANHPYPQNVDFYLAPSNNARVVDDAFWLNVVKNCIENYDVVVFDTGIDYINLKPISYVYKKADKLIIISTTSTKSVNSVTKQIGRLKGEIPSRNMQGENVYSAQDDLASKLNIVITQMVPKHEVNRTIYNILSSKANVIATFGVITDSVSRAEFYGEWDVFDNNHEINRTLDVIMS